MKQYINPYRMVAGISLGYLVTTSPVVAQITSDGTLPTNVTRSGNVWEITGGTQAGSNLFHSLSDGGNVNVDAARLRLLNGGQLTADGIFDGDGGIVNIRVRRLKWMVLVSLRYLESAPQLFAA